jgi:hypothetical protein
VTHSEFESEAVFVGSTVTGFFQVLPDGDGFVVEMQSGTWRRLAWFDNHDDAVSYANKRMWL